jgi:H+/Cl- antiporter ClcA
LTSGSSVIVELTTRKGEMRGYRGNHHEKRRLIGISCASQCTILHMAGTSHVLVHIYTNTRVSQCNQASGTPCFAYALVILHIVLIFIFFSLLLVHNYTIIVEHKVQSSLSISQRHDHEMSPSSAYTQYSIQPRLLVLPVFS